MALFFIKKTPDGYQGFFMVLRRGLEPPCPFGRYHLKVVCLPVSPPQRMFCAKRVAKRKRLGKRGSGSVH